MHQDLDRAELRFDRRDHPLDLRRVGQIAERPAGAHAVRLADRACGIAQGGALAVLGGPLLAHAVDAEGTAERREAFGERPPEPAPRPGDQSDLTLQQPRAPDHARSSALL